MKVKGLMTQTPFCCKQTDTVQQAAEMMKMHDVGAIPVISEGDDRKLVGILTDRDICIQVVAAGKTGSQVKVAQVMSKSVATCHIDDSVSSCEALMERHQVRRIPVVDGHGRCIGIVCQADIALHDSASHTSHTLAAISKPHLIPKKKGAPSMAVGAA
jgi:CBS domain-containing protein